VPNQLNLVSNIFLAGCSLKRLLRSVQGGQKPIPFILQSRPSAHRTPNNAGMNRDKPATSLLGLQVFREKFSWGTVCDVIQKLLQSQILNRLLEATPDLLERLEASRFDPA